MGKKRGHQELKVKGLGDRRKRKKCKGDMKGNRKETLLKRH